MTDDGKGDRLAELVRLVRLVADETCGGYEYAALTVRLRAGVPDMVIPVIPRDDVSSAETAAPNEPS